MPYRKTFPVSWKSLPVGLFKFQHFIVGMLLAYIISVFKI